MSLAPSQVSATSASNKWRLNWFICPHFKSTDLGQDSAALTKLLEQNGLKTHLRTCVSPVNLVATTLGNLLQHVSSHLAHGPQAPFLESYVLIRAKVE